MKYINEYNGFYSLDYDEGKMLIKGYLSWKSGNRKVNGFLSGGFVEHNLEEDVKEFKKYMKDHDFDFDIFMKRYKTKIFSDNFFTHNCGLMDEFLYYYDNKFPLSGSLVTDHEGTDLADELLIKYNYDYQDLDLGKKFILQSYNTLEDFYFACAESYCISIFLGQGNFQHDLNWRNNTNENIDTKYDLEVFSKPVRYKNCSISFIDLEKLYEFVIDGNMPYDRFVQEFDKELVKPTISILVKNEKWCAEYFGPEELKDKILNNVDYKAIKSDIEIFSAARKYNL